MKYILQIAFLCVSINTYAGLSLISLTPSTLRPGDNRAKFLVSGTLPAGFTWADLSFGEIYETGQAVAYEVALIGGADPEIIYYPATKILEVDYIPTNVNYVDISFYDNVLNDNTVLLTYSFSNGPFSISPVLNSNVTQNNWQLSWQAISDVTDYNLIISCNGKEQIVSTKATNFNLNINNSFNYTAYVQVIKDNVIIKSNKVILAPSAENISIYPNPSTGVFNIKNVTAVNKTTLYNLYGQQLISSSNCGKIDATSLPEGAYILRTQDVDGNVYVQKVNKISK